MAAIFHPALLVVLIGLEVTICRWYWREYGWQGALLAAGLANLASAAVGFLLAFALPSGLQGTAPSADFVALVWLSLPVAFVLSFVIEGAVFAMLRRRLTTLVRPWAVSFRVNLASYAVLGLLFAWYIPRAFG